MNNRWKPVTTPETVTDNGIEFEAPCTTVVNAARLELAREQRRQNARDVERRKWRALPTDGPEAA